MGREVGLHEAGEMKRKKGRRPPNAICKKISDRRNRAEVKVSPSRNTLNLDLVPRGVARRGSQELVLEASEEEEDLQERKRTQRARPPRDRPEEDERRLRQLLGVQG